MENMLSLVLVTLALAVIPGPNVALTVAHSVRHGRLHGLLTVAGTTSGVGLQLVLVILGIGTALELAAEILGILKWAGVAYLLFLAWRSWRAPVDDLSAIHARNIPPLVLFRRGFIVALLNPKTLLFNAALLPQFIAPEGDYVSQLALVALVFLSVLTAADVLWAVFAAALRPLMFRVQRFRNRFTAFLMAAAGLGLAVTSTK